jgi:hypothetical protein
MRLTAGIKGQDLRLDSRAGEGLLVVPDRLVVFALAEVG